MSTPHATRSGFFTSPRPGPRPENEAAHVIPLSYAPTVMALRHVPGDEIVVTHESDSDPYVSVRDAFDAAKRRLQDHVDRKRGR